VWCQHFAVGSIAPPSLGPLNAARHSYFRTHSRPSFPSTTPDPLEPHGGQSGIDMVEILEVCLGMFQVLFVVGSTTDSRWLSRPM